MKKRVGGEEGEGWLTPVARELDTRSRRDLIRAEKFFCAPTNDTILAATDVTLEDSEASGETNSPKVELWGSVPSGRTWFGVGWELVDALCIYIIYR